MPAPWRLHRLCLVSALLPYIVATDWDRNYPWVVFLPLNTLWIRQVPPFP